MNKIANFGSDMGNFIFIDSALNGWQEDLKEALLESLDIALESAAKTKFIIKNPAQDHEETVKAEVSYILRSKNET